MTFCLFSVMIEELCTVTLINEVLARSFLLLGPIQYYIYLFTAALMLIDTYNLVSALDLSACPEEQILNQPDMDDCVGCENQDEEVEAMVEESASGSDTILK